MLEISEIVFDTSREVDKLDNSRTLHEVLGTVVEEVGELATEINIKSGFKNRKPGKDGIVGEAVDGIIALFDVIHKEAPDLPEDELKQLFRIKCQKWYDGVEDDIKGRPVSE